MPSETESELGMLAPLDEMMHPYREQFGICSRIPTSGRDRAEVLEEMESFARSNRLAGRKAMPRARSITATTSISRL